jgi:hypothetical protein
LSFFCSYFCFYFYVFVCLLINSGRQQRFSCQQEKDGDLSRISLWHLSTIFSTICWVCRELEVWRRTQLRKVHLSVWWHCWSKSRHQAYKYWWCSKGTFLLTRCLLLPPPEKDVTD